ncbi:MAG: nucleotidyltransferase family protein [Candidatus Aminicenantes bacterium]|nr:MAG: nucleotidyltransferase family protein [Candidatus Aminicenantes bacterium]
MSWTEEDRLLLSCLRAGTDKIAQDKIVEGKISGIDWGNFLKRARDNGISALIYSKLNENKPDFPNTLSEIFEELKKDYYLNAAKNALIFEELGRILKALGTTGPQVIVLKGAALAEIVYKNLAFRPMLDIDLLVKNEDINGLDKKLKALGYGPSDSNVNDIDLSSSYLTTLDYRSSSEHSFSLHIHWHFVNSTVPNYSLVENIKMENIWRDAVEAEIADAKTLVMAPHHLLIHLSEHALRVSHSLSKISFFYDIHETINSHEEQLDWDCLISESFEFNLNRMVYLSLYFTSEFLATRIPEYVFSGLKPEHFSLGERIFMNSVSDNRHFPGLSYLVHLAMNKGLYKKARFIGRTFFPPRQIMAQRNYVSPSKLDYTYYFRRANEIFLQLLKILRLSPSKKA